MKKLKAIEEIKDSSRDVERTKRQKALEQLEPKSLSFLIKNRWAYFKQFIFSDFKQFILRNFEMRPDPASPRSSRIRRERWRAHNCEITLCPGYNSQQL